MCTTHTRCQHQTASCAWVLEALGCHISPVFLQRDPGISSTWENSPVRDIQSICRSLKHPHFRLSPQVLPSSGAWPFRVPANTTCPASLAALRHIPNGRFVEMMCVWNLGQNYISNNQFYLTSHLLSSSSTSLLGVGIAGCGHSLPRSSRERRAGLLFFLSIWTGPPPARQSQEVAS